MCSSRDSWNVKHLRKGDVLEVDLVVTGAYCTVMLTVAVLLGSVALTGADAAYLRRYRSCSNIEQLVDESDLACDVGLA